MPLSADWTAAACCTCAAEQYLELFWQLEGQPLGQLAAAPQQPQQQGQQGRRRAAAPAGPLAGLQLQLQAASAAAAAQPAGHAFAAEVLLPIRPLDNLGLATAAVGSQSSGPLGAAAAGLLLDRRRLTADSGMVQAVAQAISASLRQGDRQQQAQQAQQQAPGAAAGGAGHQGVAQLAAALAAAQPPAAAGAPGGFHQPLQPGSLLGLGVGPRAQAGLQREGGSSRGLLTAEQVLAQLQQCSSPWHGASSRRSSGGASPAQAADAAPQAAGVQQAAGALHAFEVARQLAPVGGAAAAAGPPVLLGRVLEAGRRRAGGGDPTATASAAAGSKAPGSKAPSLADSLAPLQGPAAASAAAAAVLAAEQPACSSAPGGPAAGRRPAFDADAGDAACKASLLAALSCASSSAELLERIVAIAAAVAPQMRVPTFGTSAAALDVAAELLGRSLQGAAEGGQRQHGGATGLAAAAAAAAASAAAAALPLLQDALSPPSVSAPEPDPQDGPAAELGGAVGSQGAPSAARAAAKRRLGAAAAGVTGSTGEVEGGQQPSKRVKWQLHSEGGGPASPASTCSLPAPAAAAASSLAAGVGSMQAPRPAGTGAELLSAAAARHPKLHLKQLLKQASSGSKGGASPQISTGAGGAGAGQ